MNNPNFDYQYRKLEDRLHKERERVRELVGALKDIAYSALTGQESGRIARNALAKHKAEKNDG